jgi:hypothetical protein
VSAEQDKKKGHEGHGHGHASHKAHDTASWVLTGPWAGAWKIFAGIGAVGLALSAVGYMSDTRRFAFSWMFAYITVLAIALGSIFFVLIERLTSAGWSVTVRRTAELFGYGVLALIPLFIPVILTMGHLFPWVGEGHDAKAHDTGAEHGSISLITPAYAQAPNNGAAVDHKDPQIDKGTATSAHGGNRGSEQGVPSDTGAVHGGGMANEPHGNTPDAKEHAEHQAHAQIHDSLMAKKSDWLNKNFFYVRALLYFLIWSFLALRLLGYSVAQDTSKDPQLTVRAQAFAPGATILFALSLTFAAVDWIMSLEPTWFSTIFGVYYFATAVVSSYAVIILVTLALRNSGPLQGAVTPEHYHDLGKLMFGFLVFWAYIGFSQFMLIWYAALPEETTWYHNRWDFGPWAKVTMAVIIGHFVVPFFWLISRNMKRNVGRLQVGAAILLVFHVVDIYWFVMPNYALGSNEFTFHWIDAACLLAVGGVYGALVFFRMGKQALVPVGDPRLERSLHFQNA